jgi:hypothetical protein
MQLPQAYSRTAIDPDSQTEVLNRRFKRVAWSTSLVFLSVVTVLIMELIGVIPVSPLQPNTKAGVKSPTPSHVSHTNPLSGPASAKQ